MDTFQTLCARRHGEGAQLPVTLLCLDPGDTTGWATFKSGALADAGQLLGTSRNMKDLIFIQEPTVVLTEEFRLYPWMAKEQSFSDIPTLQLIGAIKSALEDAAIPLVLQSAQEGKGFVTDEKLKEWHYFQKAHRHANDAIRHGCHALLFKPAALLPVPA